MMEKLTFALVTAAQKLKPYFQAHIVVVLTDKPLRRAMSSLEVVGQMALWAVELSEFDIQYQSCTTIKEQVVANFIAKFTLVGKQVELVWYSTTQKEIRSNAWSVWTFLRPITKQSTKP